MLKILSGREKIIFFAALFTVITGLIFNFLALPIIKKSGLLDRQILLAQEKLSKYSLLLKEKDYIQDKYQKLSSGRIVAQDAQDPLVSALSEIEGIAKQANIRIIDIRPSEARKQRLASIDFRAEATLEAYIEFIYNIESSLSLLRIEKFQLNAKPNTPALEGSFSISKLQVKD